MQEGLKDYLRGFGRGDVLELDVLAAISNASWKLRAQEELRRRATAMLAVLDDQTLRAIADGTLDCQDLCRKVAVELRST